MTDMGGLDVKRLVDESYLFRSLEEDARAVLVAAASPREFADGEALVREDEEGLELFVIAYGKVRVSMLAPSGDVELAELGPGAVIGEVAVLTQTRRTSTVEAVGPVLAVSFMAETIRELTEADPRLRDLFFRLIEGRARHTISLIP